MLVVQQADCEKIMHEVWVFRGQRGPPPVYVPKLCTAHIYWHNHKRGPDQFIKYNKLMHLSFSCPRGRSPGVMEHIPGRLRDFTCQPCPTAGIIFRLSFMDHPCGRDFYKRINLKKSGCRGSAWHFQ